MKKVMLFSLLLFSIANVQSVKWTEDESYIGTVDWQQKFTTISPHNPDAEKSRQEQLDFANKTTLSVIKSFIKDTKTNNDERQQYTQRYKEALEFLSETLGPDPILIQHLRQMQAYEATDGEGDQ